MIENYLKVAFRNILKNKTSSIINILGLSVGLASVILILLFVWNELKFDNQFENKDRIYRITTTQEHPESTDHNCETPFPLAPILKDNFSDIEYVSRVQCASICLVNVEDKKFKEKNVLFADEYFLDIFNYDWIIGNPEKALQELNSVVLTQNAAIKYFNSSDVLGKTINLENLYDLKITGIIADPPTNTHLPVSMILTLETLTPEFIGREYDSWQIILGGFFTYVMLPEESNPEFLEQNIETFLNRHLEPEEIGEQKFKLQSLKDIHFDTRYSTLNYITSKKTLWIFSIIGIFILLIACINYINLSLVKSFKRSHEIGLRKVMGAQRKELIFQFIVESLLISIITVILAFSFAEIFTPALNQYLGYGVGLKLYTGPAIILMFVLLAIVLGFVTGIYPAIIVSGFLPLKALKNKITSHSKSVRVLKDGLIIFQFMVAQILIVNLFIISKQLNYVSEKDLGFDQSSIINITVPDYKKHESLKSNLLQIPGVSSISFGIAGPCASLDERFTSIFYSKESEDPVEYECETKGVDEDYLKTFDLNLIAGEWLTVHSKSDSVRKVVVNETLIKKLGFSDPINALGTRLNFGRITGVIQDFHMESLHNNITPMVMIYYPRFFGQAYIKFNRNIDKATIVKIERVWNSNFPNNIFNYKVYDKHLASLYQEEKKAFQLIWFFSVIAIVIACLGMFAMISYILISRKKEVSIRKVLGATVSKLIYHLSKGYFSLIIIANLLAWPLAWYFAKNWLDNFAYRIEINPVPFFAALFISLVIVFLTMFYHTLRTAQSNPVNALKYE
jgi:ABC-type antimicrobial peptide transport system permease subunit